MEISNLFIYPVKSLGGILQQHSTIDDYGLQYDRNWMIINPVTNKFRSQRDTPRMCLIQPLLDNNDSLVLTARGIEDCALPNYILGEECRVQVWDDFCCGIDQGDIPAEWLSDFLHERCRLVRIPKNHRRSTRKGNAMLGYADAYSLLVMSEASLSNLNDQLVEPVPIDRFRPNIVIKGCLSHEEDQWEKIQIGNVECAGLKLCARCSIVSTDQRNAERLKEPNATLATYRRGKHLGIVDKKHTNEIYFGKYYNHCSRGSISVGDEVVVIN